MSSDAWLKALVAPLRADVVSGASVVARMGAEVLRRAAIRAQAGSLEELRWALGEVSAGILDAQPAMASLVALVRDVLSAVEDSADLESGRHAAARAADAFRSGIEERARAVAEHAAPLVPASGTVITLSSSATVRAVLLAGASDRRVVCLESRPMNEGRMTAEALAKAGVRVTLAVDAAASVLVRDADLVLLGADSIGDSGVINKIGSAALADAAARLGVPVLVVADETKILPPGFPQHVADDRPADEVWRAPAGVRVWNRYFETVPLERVSQVVTERAVMSPDEVEAMRASLELPERLRHWAESRARRAAEG